MTKLFSASLRFHFHSVNSRPGLMSKNKQQIQSPREKGFASFRLMKMHDNGFILILPRCFKVSLFWLIKTNFRYPEAAPHSSAINIHFLKLIPCRRAKSFAQELILLLFSLTFHTITSSIIKLIHIVTGPLTSSISNVYCSRLRWGIANEKLNEQEKNEEKRCSLPIETQLKFNVQKRRARKINISEVSAGFMFTPTRLSTRLTVRLSSNFSRRATTTFYWVHFI